MGNKKNIPNNNKDTGSSKSKKTAEDHSNELLEELSHEKTEENFNKRVSEIGGLDYKAVEKEERLKQRVDTTAVNTGMKKEAQKKKAGSIANYVVTALVVTLLGTALYTDLDNSKSYKEGQEDDLASINMDEVDSTFLPYLLNASDSANMQIILNHLATNEYDNYEDLLDWCGSQGGSLRMFAISNLSYLNQKMTLSKDGADTIQSNN